MTRSTRPSPAQRLWRSIISLRVTISLLICLSAVCIIGTVIPQNAPQQDYLHLYNEQTYHVLLATGMTDLFHAWWFYAIMGLFFTNLLACTLNRVRHIRRRMRPKPAPEPAALKEMPFCRTFTLTAFDAQHEEEFVRRIGNTLSQPVTTRTARGVTFFAERGRWAPLAFFLTHLGVVLILIGALVGALGYQGYLQLYEHQQADHIHLRGSPEIQPLGFALRCDKFEVSFYDANQMPKDYKSTLTVIENGQEVLTKQIEVNDPLIYHGIYFYQSSYGAAPDRGKIALQAYDATGKKCGLYRVAPGETFTLDGTSDTVTLARFVPDFTLGPEGTVVSRSPSPNNPAVQVQVRPANGAPYADWAFLRFPDFHHKPGRPYRFVFTQFQPLYYTGLQVTRDPGIWIVWAGCLAMTIGIYLAFFLAHRRIWVAVAPHKKTLQVTLAGSASKNQAAFQQTCTALLEQLKQTGKSSC